MNFNVEEKIRTRTLCNLDTQHTCHYISLTGFHKFLYRHNCLNTVNTDTHTQICQAVINTEKKNKKQLLTFWLIATCFDSSMTKM